jgi:hypothetical protein
MGDLLLSRPKANDRHSVRRQCASAGRGLGTRRPARPGNIIFLCERYTRARTRSAAQYSILNKNAVGVILIRPFRLMDTAPTLPMHVHSGRFTLQARQPGPGRAGRRWTPRVERIAPWPRRVLTRLRRGARRATPNPVLAHGRPAEPARGAAPARRLDRRGIRLSQGQAVRLLMPCSIQPTCRLLSGLVLSGLVR